MPNQIVSSRHFLSISGESSLLQILNTTYGQRSEGDYNIHNGSVYMLTLHAMVYKGLRSQTPVGQPVREVFSIQFSSKYDMFCKTSAIWFELSKFVVYSSNTTDAQAATVCDKKCQHQILLVCVWGLGIAIFIHSRVTSLSHNNDGRGDSQGRYVLMACTVQSSTNIWRSSDCRVSTCNS